MTMTWAQFKVFVGFFIASIISLGGVATVWVQFGFPVAASQNYVDVKHAIAIKHTEDKFQTASEDNRQVKSQLTSSRLQLNKINRQALEAEKYRLTQQAKTDITFEIQQRINDIADQIEEAIDERKRLLSPSN